MKRTPKKTLNFGLDENLTLLDSRPQTSSDKNIRHKDTKGDTRRRATIKIKQKIMKGSHFFQENPKFWVETKITLLDSRPKPPQTKIFGTRTPRGTQTEEQPSKSNPKNNEKRLAPYFSKKNPKFWVRQKPNPTRLTSKSSDKIFGTRTPRGHDRRATVKINPKKIMKRGSHLTFLRKT
jgi:hypothetical protein